MIDAHVHLEKGDYCIEWIQEFIRYALLRDIDEIYFLEHTHIFKECQSLYSGICEKLDRKNKNDVHRQEFKVSPACVCLNSR